uniref:EC51 protein n=1 Tax=Colletotrichum higginsianum TaxID=80884 RepID=I2G7D0_9PEZI|nr:EC51 protein [Colletotrichum higginsianum]
MKLLYLFTYFSMIAALAILSSPIHTDHTGIEVRKQPNRSSPKTPDTKADDTRGRRPKESRQGESRQGESRQGETRPIESLEVNRALFSFGFPPAQHILLVHDLYSTGG